MTRITLVTLLFLAVSSTSVHAELVGDEITGLFKIGLSSNLLDTNIATVAHPGEEFRGVAYNFGETGHVEVFVDISENELRIGFDSANMTVHSAINTNYNLTLGDLDFGPDLRIASVTLVGQEGTGLITGGGPASWDVSFTRDSISIEHITGWAMVPDRQAIAVYAIEREVDTTPVCACPGDLNNDGMVNGGDIQSFIACYTAPDDTCDCADIDGSLGIESSDLAAFIDELLAGVSCP